MKTPIKRWTKEETEGLINDLRNGLTYREIAARLKRTIFSVEQRVRTIRMEKRGSDITYEIPKGMITPQTAETQPIEPKEVYYKKQFSQIQAELRKLQESLGLEGIITEHIFDIAPKSYETAPNIYVKPAGGNTPVSAMLMFSDPHVGKKVEPDQTLGLGNYNADVFLDRLQFLEHSVLNILRDNVVPLNKFVVAMLGDILDGALNHGNEADQHMTMVQQYYIAGHAIAQFLRNLSPYVPLLEIRTVSGNHARWMNQKRMPTTNRYSNYDTMVYILAEALTRDIPNIKWFIDRQPFCKFELENHEFYASHGDNLRGGDKALGIPNHAVGRQISTTTQLFYKAGERVPNYFICGHLHRRINLPTGMGEVIVNGAFVGIDNYALNENFNPVDPTQTFFYVHPKYGKTMSTDIKLKFADLGLSKYTIPIL